MDNAGIPQFSMHAWGEFYQKRRNDIFGAFAAKEIPICFGRCRVLKSGKVPVPYFTSSPLSPNWSDPIAYPVLDSDH